MDIGILSMVIGELSADLPGSRVDKAVPLETGGLALFLHKGTHRRILFLGPDRSAPRIYLLSRKPEPAPRPSGFYLQVKKHIAGARLIAIGLLGGDRIVEIRFQRSAGKAMLLFELTGGGCNMVLTDGDNRITAVLHPKPLQAADKRVVLPGMTYEPPPFRSADEQQLQVRTKLLDGPALEGELATNRAVEAWYERAADRKRSADERTRIGNIIRRSREKVERRISAIEKDLAGASQADDVKEQADLILANLGSIRKGMERCELPDHEGHAVTVHLDPGKTPLENVDRLYHRYKKAKAGIALMRDRLQASRDERDLLASIGNELEQGADDDLDKIGALLRKRGFGDRSSGSRKKTGSPLSAPYRVVRFKEWEILVGKSAAGNDYITMSLARPDDLWLHAEGMPGSHVLVKNPRRSDVPPDVMAKAASLAAYYSRGKGSTKVPVAYTQAKYVKKPQGAKPGMVILIERRSVMAVPEPA